MFLRMCAGVPFDPSVDAGEEAAFWNGLVEPVELPPFPRPTCGPTSWGEQVSQFVACHAW